MNVSNASADLVPVVIAVKEEALAVSLELTVQALDLNVLIHDPSQGLGTMPLSSNSTLIIDRQLLPRDPRGFIARLREQLWDGTAIVLTEDAGNPDPIVEPVEGVVVLEKPFGSAELLTLVRRAHGGAA